MAYLHRLIFCALVALSAWVPCTSFAYPAIPAVGGYVAPIGNNNYSSTALAACQNWLGATMAVNPGSSAGGVTISGTICSWHYTWSGSVQSGTWATAFVGPSCGSGGGTLSGSDCTCTAPAVDTGTACTVDPLAGCKALNASGAPLVTNASTPGLNGCYAGYVVKATGGAFGIKNGVVAPGELYGPFTCTTTPCSMTTTGGSSTSDTAPPPSNTDVGAGACKPTEYWGVVNGLGTCVKAVNTSFGGNNNTASNPGGSASAPTSGLGSSAPPSATSSTTRTDCASGSCTTTTDFKNSSGATVGTSTETKPQTTFCQDNPSASLCAQSSYGGASCGSVPSCSGDAIQCAQAAEAFKTSCALTTAPSNDTNINAFNTAAAQSQGDQTGAITSTVNLGPGSFDQTNILGAASGLDDVNVTVLGHVITLPFSNVNVWLARLGIVLQGVTFLLCARIVARG